MKQVTITLFKFAELSDRAKQKAIDEQRDFLLSRMSPDDFISGDPEYDTPEELQKIYDAEYDYYLMDDDPIIESIEANNYYFFFSGTFAGVTNHPGGKNVFEHAGKTYVFYDNEEAKQK